MTSDEALAQIRAVVNRRGDPDLALDDLDEIARILDRAGA